MRIPKDVKADPDAEPDPRCPCCRKMLVMRRIIRMKVGRPMMLAALVSVLES